MKWRGGKCGENVQSRDPHRGQALTASICGYTTRFYSLLDILIDRIPLEGVLNKMLREEGYRARDYHIVKLLKINATQLKYTLYIYPSQGTQSITE